MSRGAASRGRGHGHGLNALVPHQAASVEEAGVDIGAFEPRIPFKDSLRRVARSEHAEHVLYRETTAAYYRFATKDLRIDLDAAQELVFTVHDERLYSLEARFLVPPAPKGRQKIAQGKRSGALGLRAPPAFSALKGRHVGAVVVP